MNFANVEVELVQLIDTTDWDSQVIIRASKNKKVYRYYYVSLITGGWKVLNRKPSEKATTQQIQHEGLELQNHPNVRMDFLNHSFKETKIPTKTKKD
ncbi:hypothetical protein [Ammoniphilus sp. YIM 78166]|uniref:hypothetical protein n=1 Tax=Ammoniphilus sp. YIM 78166 TaxID=1644106 RepID=UPI00106F1649|nr:hypothetical protein [Ammoniphilus sp. YIM 78166]